MKHWNEFSFLRSRNGSRVSTDAPDSAETDILEPEVLEDDPDLSIDDVCLDTDPAVADKDLLASVLLQTASIGATAKQVRKLTRDHVPATNWKLPGFEGKCRVATNFGDLPIEALRRRDMVKTISGAYKEVQWVDAIRLDAEFIARHPEALPILIRAKSLGGMHPTQNMLVSPGQTVCETRPSGETRIRSVEDMEGSPGILRQRRAELTYYRFHCGSPEKVCVEGAYFMTFPEG